MKDQIFVRMYVVLAVLSIFPVLIAAQVLKLAFVEGSELREQGRKQASSFVETPAMRGTIMDHSGRMLAVNTARYDLALDPSVDGFTSSTSRKFFDRLSDLTGQPASSFRRKVRNRTSPQYVLLLRNLNETQKETIESWDVPGIVLRPEFARRYNYGPTASHIIGYVDPDGKGMDGIEKQFDAYLRGLPGRRAVKRDRMGVIKAFVGGTVVEPKHGESLVLTIDLIRQTIMEEELAAGVRETGSNWGTAIAMDPRTGAILAMTNVPTYDPNSTGRYTPAERRNRAITDRIEPGSTFKMVTAVAAVEKGVVDLDDVIDTGPGWAVFGGRPLRDSHPLGKVTFAEALAQSSNVALAQVGSQLEPGVLYQYARNLGFGQPTWIELPGETGGLLKKPARWSRTTRSRISIGYEVDVTPLQVLTAYCSLANGGLLVHPYLVEERRDVAGRTVWKASQDSIRRAFKKETAATLLPAFQMVVDSGTAKRAHIDGLSIAGKTGTAIKSVSGGYQRGAHRASFVGFFPADDPAVALIVVLDEPKGQTYGGDAAAPIFQRIAKRWLGTLPQVAQRLAPPKQKPAPRPAAVPDVVGKPAEIAGMNLRAAGYYPDGLTEANRWQVVRSQVPAAGVLLMPGARVRLAFGSAPEAGSGSIPNVVGMSSRQAVAWLSRLGFKVRMEGSGVVAEQQPGPGPSAEKRIRLVCRSSTL